MTKRCLSVLFQLVEWYDLNLGSFVKLPNLAKCQNPSWSFGQLQAEWSGMGRLWITSLNSHLPLLKLNTKYREEKSGAKNSAFS
jgi:hypothetical protein